MSRKKNKKKHQIQKKKKSKKKPIIVSVCVAVAAVIIVVGAIVIDRMTNLKYVDFVGYSMLSQSGYDSKGKEIDLYDLYNVVYDDYHGSLQFNDDGTFSLWMTPGPVDGSNDGTFTYNRGENVIKGEYKSGDKIEFKIVRNKDGTINHIEAPYEEYTIYFS